MLVMTIDGYNKRSGSYHGTWSHTHGGGLGMSRPDPVETQIIDAIQQAQTARDGLDGIEAEHGRLSAQYLAGLDTFGTNANRAGQLFATRPDRYVGYRGHIDQLLTDAHNRMGAAARMDQRVQQTRQRYGDRPVTRGGGLPGQAYKNMGVLKDLNKRFRQLGLREMTRKERSDLYDTMVDLLDQLYNVFQDPDAPDFAQWRVLKRRIPQRGMKDTGGADLLAVALWRGINTLYKDPKGRTNALMLVVKAAKLTSGLLQNHLPFLQDMAQALGFPLTLEDGVTGMLGDRMMITDDGITVRPDPTMQAAQTMLQLGQ